MNEKCQWLPNALSISRIPLGLLLILLYQPHNPRLLTYALAVVALALITDIADGKIARASGCTSRLGYMLDGLGDKAFYVAFLLVIQREYPASTTLCWLLIVREIAMYSLRVVSKDIESELKKLRVYSLLHAFWIRLWFLIVIVNDISAMIGHGTGWLMIVGLVCGSFAAISGGIGLAGQIRFVLE
ncbi:CDP-alcohol phosphatidyltransferase family protein [Pseudodesulfovibrio sediminis]|uniref:CDP-diacylglycerol--glycerol-3-phosphate 3-phosphatidyltransferase n=1 Tax=Pseudodesulfovibrio sediminis TaxID=2810563 RepID=A0ABM9SDM2_9BACT|nr:CDP-alcohol phosphatidyltransferase family protein [Pseudodesulfovibrio sediminis]BCS88168.1 hypothetical protein PSDVSF_14100 [Pseudodesulfovibrio sediminis]